MPTVLRSGPYRLFFYSSDAGEPRHVHVQRDTSVAKFWLDPTQLDQTDSFRRSEIRRIEGIIAENHERLTEAWDEHFSQ